MTSGQEFKQVIVIENNDTLLLIWLEFIGMYIQIDDANCGSMMIR